MKKITMADYYNTQAVLQENKLLKDPYECNLFEHEYDEILSEFTLQDFIHAANNEISEHGRLTKNDYPETKILWELDTPCRDVFYRLIYRGI